MSVYDVLAERMGFKGSKYLPQVFESAANERQARLLAEMLESPGPPLTAEQLAQRTGFDKKAIVEDLDLLWRRGVAFPRNFQRREEWRGPRSMGQIHDSMLCAHMFYSDREKLRQAWKDFDEKERYDRVVADDLRRNRQSIRVVPVWESVKDNPNLQPWEDWRAIYSKAEPISVVDCPCRFKLSDAHKLLNSCIDLNRAAEYDIASGHGRKLTPDEALKLTYEAAVSGLVPQAPNVRDVTRSMCNCCDCCCVAWLPLKERGIDVKKVWSPSRYEARVDQALCSGCQKCIDQCMFDSMEMEKVAGAKKMKAVAEAEKCMGCGLCFVVCEDKAITMECVRPEEHVPLSAPMGASAA